MVGIGLCAGYALVVTFARTAYAAALLATIVASLGWAWAAARRDTGASVSPVLLFVLVGGVVLTGVATPFMAERFQHVLPDLADREGDWQQGLALRDGGLTTALFGMGLGTYPRTVLAHRPDGRFPTNFIVAHDGGYSYLSLSAGLPEYFGQKVIIKPDSHYRLFLPLRSQNDKGKLSVFLCEKLLLYSDNCRSVVFTPQIIGEWEDFRAEIPTVGLSTHTYFHWFSRPVELSLFDPIEGTTVDIGHIRVFDPQGYDIIRNGDFSRGTERWYFTDDEHRIWRIKNQYLMSLFEGGILGLVAFALLIGTALTVAVRAIGRGDHMAAPITGSLVAILFSSLFDDLLGVPRLATLIYLIALSGLAMAAEQPRAKRPEPRLDRPPVS